MSGYHGLYGSKAKIKELTSLAHLRRKDSFSDFSVSYSQAGEFHEGILDDPSLISPWTKSAGNVDSRVMLVGQDWYSVEGLKSLNPDQLAESARSGQLSGLPTNKNIRKLLREHFDMNLDDVYATNAFPFIKEGAVSSRLFYPDVRAAIKKFLLPQISIVRPSLVICLGAGVFQSLERVLRSEQFHKPMVSWKQSLEAPLRFGSASVVGLPHPGGLGMAAVGGITEADKFWRQAAIHLKV